MADYDVMNNNETEERERTEDRYDLDIVPDDTNKPAEFNAEGMGLLIAAGVGIVVGSVFAIRKAAKWIGSKLGLGWRNPFYKVEKAVVEGTAEEVSEEEEDENKTKEPEGPVVVEKKNKAANK